MSELMLKVQNGTGYKDGDCLHGFTDCRIQCASAQNVLFKKDPTTNNNERADAEGLIPENDASQDFYEQTHQFKFQRTGKNTATVTRLSDNNTISFESNKPFVQHDGKTVQMDIQKWLRKKRDRHRDKNHGGFPMFGTVGHEIWYGGRTTIDEQRVSNVWTNIENKLQLDRNDYKKWPVGNLDIKHYINIPVATLTERQAAFIEQPAQLTLLNDENFLEAVSIAKRSSRVDYHNLPIDQTIKSMIPDRILPVDIRDLYLFELDEILMEDNMNTPFVILDQLKTEIETDPAGLYTNLNNSEIVETINAKQRTFTVALTSAELLAWASQNSRIAKIRAAAADGANQALQSIAIGADLMVSRDNTMLDLNLPDRVAMLDALVTGAVLVAADKTDLETMASYTGSRAEELFGKNVIVYQSHVDYVRPE